MIRAPAGPTPGTARVREWPGGQRRQLWTAALRLGRSTKSNPGAIVCRGWLPGILLFHSLSFGGLALGRRLDRSPDVGPGPPLADSRHFPPGAGRPDPD